jgi:hypothetical protein
LKKKTSIFKKLATLGIDDFKFCSITYETITLPWWDSIYTEVDMYIMFRENEAGIYEIKIYFYCIYDYEDLDTEVFSLKFSEDDLLEESYIHKKLYKQFFPSEKLKATDTKDLFVIDDFKLAFNVLDHFIELVKDVEIQSKNDSTPTPEDPVYTAVTQVLKGELTVEPLKQQLIDWIRNRFQIQVVHLIYDTIDNGEIYRIRVVTRERDEADSMRNTHDINYNPKFQQEIADAYDEIYGEHSVMHTGNYEKLFVCYDNFHDLHAWHGRNFVPKEEKVAILEEFSELHIWQIVNFFGAPFVCFYTREEAQNLSAEKEEALRKRLYIAEKAVDEFDELTEENFTINIYSKESLDEDYDGNFLNMLR